MSFLKSIFGPETSTGATSPAAQRESMAVARASRNTPASTPATAASNDWDTSPVVAESAPATPAPAPATIAPVATAQTLRETASESATTASPDELGTDLPDGLGECLAEMTRVRIMPDRPDFQWKAARAARSHALGLHYHKLCNTPAVSAMRRTHSPHVQKIIALVQDECAPQIAGLKAKHDDYFALKKQLSDEGKLPNSAKPILDRLEGAICNATNPDEVEKLVAKKNQILGLCSQHQTIQNGSVVVQNDTSYGVGINAIRQTSLKFLEMGDAVVALEKAIDAVLTTHQKELVKSEADFFAKHGLKHQPTQLSASVATVRSHLADITGIFHNCVKNHGDRHPSVPINFDPVTFAELFA